MAKGKVTEDKRRTPKRKSSKIVDEDISEDEAFNEEDEAKYGRFFQNRKQKVSEDVGELWDCLFEGSPEGDVPDEASEAVKDDTAPSGKVERKRRVEEEFDDRFTRVEDDEDLFTEETADGDSGGFNWITDADDVDAKYAGLVNKFREIQNELPEVFKEESRAKISREERKELYESVKKDVSKRWEPVLQYLKHKKHIVYGEQKERTDPTCGSLTQLEAETPLEKELEAQVNSAYERALRSREVRKQRRINRIKSKKWHKRQKKRDLELYAKLIEKSNDPDLTKELLESFEQKRSKHRILRKKNAQQKWAKLAMRFGDRNVLKQISSEQQKLKDDLAFIKDTIDGVKEREDSDSDGSNDEYANESDEDYSDDEPNDEVLEKLNIIANPREATVPQKGLFALKFMKDMLQSKMEGNEQEDAQQGSTTDHLDDYEEDSSANEADSDAEHALESTNTNNSKMKTDVPTVSDADLKVAMRQIQIALGFEQDDDSNVPKFDADIKVNDSNQMKFAKPAASDLRGTPSGSKPSNVQERGSKAKTDAPKQAKVTSIPNLLEENDGLENFIKNLGPARKRAETVEVAKRLFVTRPDEEAYLSGDDTEEEEDAASDKLKGWGSWTGFGIVNTKPEKKEAVEPAKKKRTLKVSSKRDPKLGKYILHKVPHPYKNKHDYNAKMATSIGPEWNTSKMHAQLVQPKTVIKVGSVVKPLSVEGTKDYVQRMGKTFNRNRTHARL